MKNAAIAKKMEPTVYSMPSRMSRKMDSTSSSSSSPRAFTLPLFASRPSACSAAVDYSIISTSSYHMWMLRT